MGLNRRFKYTIAASTMAMVICFGNSASFAANAPAKIDDVVKAYGLNQPSSNFTYASKTVDNGVATFTKVKIGEDTSADSLIISLSPDTQNLDFKFVGAILGTGDSFGAADEIFIHSKDKFDVANDKASIPFVKDGAKLNGDVTFKNLRMKTEDKTEFNIGKLYIEETKFNGSDLTGFKYLSGEKISFPVDNMNIKIGSIVLDQPNSAIFDEISKDKKGMAEGPSEKELFDSATFKQLKITDINIMPVAKAAKDEKGNQLIGINLGNIQVDDYSKDKIGNFALNNIVASGLYENDVVNFRLAEFSFKDLDLAFFKKYLGAFLGGADEEETKAFLNTKLKDIFVGGPLYNGLSAFNLSGISLEGAGASMTLDQLAVKTTKNDDKIVTSYEMPVGNFAMKVTDANKAMGMMLSMGLEQLGLDAINVSYGAKATYDIANDKVDMNNTFFKWDKFGQFNIELALLGQAKWLENTTMGDLMAVAKNAAKVSAKPTKSKAVKGKKGSKSATHKSGASKTAANSNDTRELMDLLHLYRGVKVSHFNLEIADLGGLDRFATKEGFDKKIDVKKVRANWAADINKEANDKKNGPLEAKFLNALSKFMSIGGTLYMKFDDANGLDIANAVETKVDPNTLGIEFGVKP